MPAESIAPTDRRIPKKNSTPVEDVRSYDERQKEKKEEKKEMRQGRRDM